MRRHVQSVGRGRVDAGIDAGGAQAQGSMDGIVVGMNEEVQHAGRRGPAVEPGLEERRRPHGTAEVTSQANGAEDR